MVRALPAFPHTLHSVIGIKNRLPYYFEHGQAILYMYQKCIPMKAGFLTKILSSSSLAEEMVTSLLKAMPESDV